MIDFAKRQIELERQKVMEDQAHLYGDADIAQIVASARNVSVPWPETRDYFCVVAERGSWFVVECRRTADNVLVDIL